MKVEVDLERLEEIAARLIIVYNNAQMDDCMNLVSALMAVVHEQRDYLLRDHSSIMHAKTSTEIEEVEEGEPSISIGMVRQKKEEPAMASPGAIPAQAPDKIYRDVASQTPQELYIFPAGVDGAGGDAAFSLASNQLVSVADAWQEIERLLIATKKAASKAKKDDEAAFKCLDQFLQRGNAAKEAAGKWIDVIERKREEVAAIEKIRNFRKLRVEAEKAAAIAKEEAEVARKKYNEAKLKEREARSRLQRNGQPEIRRPYTYQPTCEPSQQNTQQRSSDNWVNYCKVCGHVGVRRPRDCPNRKNH